MIRALIKPSNFVLAAYSYLASSITGRPDMNGMPLAVGVELTNNCNLKCPECSSGSGQMTRKRGYMDTEFFKRVINELKPYLYNTNLYFQGEPMLHPGFFSFLEYSLGTHATVSTNGHFLSADNCEKIVKSGLDKIIISLDGIDQETYSKYRINGNINTVINGIQTIAEARDRIQSHLKVEIQFLVSRINEHQIAQAKELAKKNKIKLRLKSMQITEVKDIDKWLPIDGRFRRYVLEKGEYRIKNSFPNRCARLWFNPVITWDGIVLPCCFDKDAEHVMGDLNHDSFRDIWNGPKYRIFRKSILSGRHMIDICTNCTSGIIGVKY
jgi:radical SAM protein with 4Fe4S-binding SPASM domain